jgi:competence protein ComEA
MKEWMERYRAILFVLLVLAVLAGIVLLQVLRPKAPPTIMAGLTPAPSPAPSSTPLPLQVYVSGAVQQPDVYVLPPGSIVKDAIQAAGGAAEGAELDRINLAQRLVDGQQVHVPRVGESELPPSVRVQPMALAKVNINTAQAAELETLPGIGPALAQRIVEYRQAHGRFERVEDLMNVSGIGPAAFEKLRTLIATD